MRRLFMYAAQLLNEPACLQTSARTFVGVAGGSTTEEKAILAMKHPVLTPIKAGLMVATAGAVLLSAAAWAADIEYPGFVKVENFDNVSGDAVALLLAAPRYVANDPDSITFLNSLYWSRNPSADNYGSRITGYITPKDTADYVFFIASDNDSSLYLSTDSTPANLKLIAADQGWQNARTWTGPGGTTSGDGTTSVVYRRGFNPTC
jgi:hypothetical protein